MANAARWIGGTGVAIICVGLVSLGLRTHARSPSSAPMSPRALPAPLATDGDAALLQLKLGHAQEDSGDLPSLSLPGKSTLELDTSLFDDPTQTDFDSALRGVLPYGELPNDSGLELGTGGVYSLVPGNGPHLGKGEAQQLDLPKVHPLPESNGARSPRSQGENQTR